MAAAATAGDGDLRYAVHERAAVDLAVDVEVIGLESPRAARSVWSAPWPWLLCNVWDEDSFGAEDTMPRAPGGGRPDLQRIVPWYLYDVRACDLVVPRLPFRILQNPEPAEPEHREREDAREASHQRVDEAQRLAVRSG